MQTILTNAAKKKENTRIQTFRHPFPTYFVLAYLWTLFFLTAVIYCSLVFFLSHFSLLQTKIFVLLHCCAVTCYVCLCCNMHTVRNITHKKYALFHIAAGIQSNTLTPRA